MLFDVHLQSKLNQFKLGIIKKCYWTVINLRGNLKCSCLGFLKRNGGVT